MVKVLILFSKPYLDNTRYWFSTQPSVTRLAQDRAEQIQQDTDKVWEEIIRRLRTDKQRGEFAGVHMAPSSTSDVPDDNSVRLVVLAPQHPHKAKEDDTLALIQADEILNSKGASPRYCKNMLLFLAPDSSKLELLEKNVCQYLAWNSIIQEKESLNLDVFQTNQATTKQQQTEKDVKNLIQETYIWLLVPIQPDTHGAIEWQEIRLQKHDSPVLQHLSMLYPSYVDACKDANRTPVTLNKFSDFFVKYCNDLGWKVKRGYNDKHQSCIIGEIILRGEGTHDDIPTYSQVLLGELKSNEPIVTVIEQQEPPKEVETKPPVVEPPIEQKQEPPKVQPKKPPVVQQSNIQKLTQGNTGHVVYGGINVNEYVHIKGDATKELYYVVGGNGRKWQLESLDNAGKRKLVNGYLSTQQLILADMSAYSKE